MRGWFKFLREIKLRIHVFRRAELNMEKKLIENGKFEKKSSAPIKLIKIF